MHAKGPGATWLIHVGDERCLVAGFVGIESVVTNGLHGTEDFESVDNSELSISTPWSVEKFLGISSTSTKPSQNGRRHRENHQGVNQES